MSTFNISADRLGYVNRASYSSWNTKGASQGAVVGGYPRVGALVFSALRSSVEWADQEIGAIRLTLTFSQAGLNREKTLYMYKGTQNALTGTGTAMLGEAIGTAKTNGTAYTSTRTILFSSESNPAAFAKLVEWIQNGTTNTLALYVNEAASDYDWSTNYLYISAAALSVDHEVKGSKGDLSADAVEAGSSITLKIEPMEAEGTVTHKVQWKFGSLASVTTMLPSTTTVSTYTVPLTWLAQIPDALSGKAQCVLTTLVDGVQKAQRSIPFTVNVPESVVPEFTASAASSGTSGGYYQYIGAAIISFADINLPYGADAVAFRIAGAEGVTAAASSVTTEKFQTSGMHTYTLTLTDSRGRSTTHKVSIDVKAVALPQITEFSVQRYSSRVDDGGSTIYEASTDGNKVWATIAAAVDLAGGNNTPSAYILYGPEDGTQSRVYLSWPSSAAAYNVENSRTLITAVIPLDDAYDFELVVSDEHTSVTASSRVEQSWAILHMAGNGQGVAGGMYSTATEDAPRFESAWEASFYGGIRGVTNYTEAETPTGGTWIDGNPIYRRVVTFGEMAANSESHVPIGVGANELGLVIDVKGMAYTPYEGYMMLLPNPSKDNNWMVQMQISNMLTAPAVTIITGTARAITSGFVIVEYTKVQ